MKNILIVSQNGLSGSLLCIKNGFEKIGYSIDTYPLLKYLIENKNYKEHFVDYIKETSPDILLWSFIDVPTDTIKYISDNTNIFSILVCWNDPFIWSDKNSDIKNKCLYFDIAISMCKETKSLFNLPVIDCIVGHPENEVNENEENEYLCDVSFCCVDLYEDLHLYPTQLIPRKDLINKLCEIHSDNKITFNLYGPHYLYSIYPENYKGFIEYNDLNNIFSKSRININTHSCNNEGYINERVSLILGSGGLLLTDKIKGIDDIIGDNSCVYIKSLEDIETQIYEILNNYQYYQKIKSNGFERSKSFSWEKWVFNVHKYLSLYFFNEDYYRGFYYIPPEVINLKEYWEKTGLQKNHIPYSFNVHKFFDYSKYSIDKGIIKNKQYLYWHYRINSRESKYIKTIDYKNFKTILNNCKIDSITWFKLNECFTQILSNKDVDQNILLIGEMTDNSPEIDVSKLLDLYFDITEN